MDKQINIAASPYHAPHYVPASPFAVFREDYNANAARPDAPVGVCFYTTAAQDRFFAFGTDAVNVRHVTGREVYFTGEDGSPWRHQEVIDIRGKATMREVLYEMATGGWIVRIDVMDV